MCLFHISQTLIAGWDKLECHRAFNFLCELTHLLKNIEAVLIERPGEWIHVWRLQKNSIGTVEDSYKIGVFIDVAISTGLKKYQERQIRLYCRHVLLDHWPNQPVKQFWLNLLLSPWPLVSQARLLFILYGPSLPDGKNEHNLPHAIRVSVTRLLHRLITVCVFCFELWYKHVMQEPWVGIAWWRWICHAGPFGMWPMQSIYFLVILKWKTSPISRCWPSWRSLLVMDFISYQHLSAHTKKYNVSEKICSCLSTFLPPSSYSSAVACRQCSPAPGTLWELTVLHHSSQQGHQWEIIWGFQTLSPYSTGERVALNQ